MPREVRLHGVSGTPPRNLLYNDPVTYDLVPDLAKVYEPSRDEWNVKAFHWGSLTSKSSPTAFWILLAPFAMANVAAWMSESPNIWSRIWIRLAGLTLTGIFFAQLANMALDIPIWPRWFHPLAPPAYGPYAVTRANSHRSGASRSDGRPLTGIAHLRSSDQPDHNRSCAWSLHQLGLPAGRRLHIAISGDRPWSSGGDHGLSTRRSLAEPIATNRRHRGASHPASRIEEPGSRHRDGPLLLRADA